MLLLGSLAQLAQAGGKAHRQPGREDEGGKQREQHGYRTQGRDGLHVGPHHAAHEAHGHQRRDDGKGGKDGGVAHLAHGVDRGRRVDVFLEQPAPIDVLHHHDGIVHQDADGEDEGEQGHAVDGVAQDQGGEHGKQDDDGDDDEHHRSRAPAQRVPDQDGDRTGGDEQLEDQFVDLVVGGLAVVAGYGHMDIVRDHPALEVVDLGQHVIGHGHAIGTLLLGDRQGDGRGAIDAIHAGQFVVGLDLLIVFLARLFLDCGSGVVAHHAVRLAGAKRNLGDITDVDGLVVAGTDDQALDILDRLEEAAGIDREHAVVSLDLTHAHLAIGGLDRLHDLAHAQVIAGQLLRQDAHIEAFFPTADDEALAGVGDLVQLLLHLQRHQLEGCVVHVLGPEGERDDGHVVHRLGLDQRRRGPGWDLVLVRLQLVVELDQRVLHVLADLELYGDHGLLAHGHGIDMLDAGQLRHQPFQRSCHQIGDLLGGTTRIAHEDVHHRHRDLRVFLARREQQADETKPDADHQQQRGERRMDEGPGQIARDSEMLHFLHLGLVAPRIPVVLTHVVSSLSGDSCWRCAFPSGISGDTATSPSWRPPAGDRRSSRRASGRRAPRPCPCHRANRDG